MSANKILRGHTALLKPLSPESFAEAIGYFERALALDPGSVAAKASLAGTLAGRVLEGMTETRAADSERAEALARQALAASPRSPGEHAARAQVLRAQDHYKDAIPEYEAAIAFNRNAVGAISALADCKLHAGPIEEVVPLQEQALRLSPRDPLISNMYNRIGIAYLLQSRTDEAIVWLEKAREANPTRSFPYAGLASAHALEGDIERASAELADALPARASFALQPIDEVDDGVEAAPGPAADAGPRNSYGQMRLAVAGRRRHRPASSMPCSEILAPQLPQGVT